MAQKVSFKNMFTKESLNIAKEGVAWLNLKGNVFPLPIKVKGISSTILDIESKPNKVKLKKIAKKMFQLDEETRKIIENSEGFNPNDKGQTVIMYDITDEETSKELKRTLLKSKLLELVKDINMDYVDEEMNIDLWEYWGIEKNNYDALSEWFLEADIDDEFIKELSVQIAKVKNGTLEEVEVLEEEKQPSKRRKKSTDTKEA